MTFLSCLTLGAVTLVRDTASVWESQISREATIQIKPAEGLDMEAALEKAAEVASGFPGVTGARIVDREATARLLEPWLGTGLNIDELPVPRLVIVTIDEANPPNFARLREAITAEIPQASLDDHRTWVDRLVTMARTTVTIGIAVLALMLTATVLSVVFATRGAMAGNGHIIEVLHFVGAEARFIASGVPPAFPCNRHEGRGCRRASRRSSSSSSFPSGRRATWRRRRRTRPPRCSAISRSALSGYAGVALIVLVIGVLTAATSHVTVVAYLTDIETRQTD